MSTRRLRSRKVEYGLTRLYGDMAPPRTEAECRVDAAKDRLHARWMRECADMLCSHGICLRLRAARRRRAAAEAEAKARGLCGAPTRDGVCRRVKGRCRRHGDPYDTAFRP